MDKLDQLEARLRTLEASLLLLAAKIPTRSPPIGKAQLPCQCDRCRPFVTGAHA